MGMGKIKIGSQFSGIGAFEQAFVNIGIPHKTIMAVEWDKYARKTYSANFGEPKHFYEDSYEADYKEVEELDYFLSSPPCQAFSLAGKRLGESDERGILFYETYRFIKDNKPKYFIIENVKGLLSDNDGATFRNWINLLGQSENGNPFFFPHEDSLMYNLHWQVLNTKDYGLPQNRERVFLVGIRNDLPNDFVFPKGVPLTKRLKDVLETNVDEKYYLSDKMVQGFINHAERHSEKGNGFKFEPKDVDSIANTITTTEGSRGYNNFIEDSNNIANCITARCFKMGIDDNYIQENVSIGAMRGRNPENPKSRQSGLPTEQMLEINKDGVSNTLTSVQKDNLVVESTRIAGWFENENVIGAYRNDKKRSSVSEHIYHKVDGVANTIQTAHAPKVIEPQLTQIAQLDGFESEGRIYDANGISRTIKNGGGGGSKTGWYMVEEEQIINPLKGQTEFGWHFEQNVFSEESICRTLKSSEGSGNKPKIIQGYRIRRLSPLECFRLQGFPDSFEKVVSDTQLYKQAGNTISVPVIQAILKNLLK